MALARRSFGAGAAAAPEVFPIGGCPGVRDHAAEHGPGPHGSTGTPPPWPGPPEASGDHMVGASRQPPAQRGLIFLGFYGAWDFGVRERP